MHIVRLKAGILILEINGKVKDCYCSIKFRSDLKNWCKRCTNCAANTVPNIENRGCMLQYNVGHLNE